MNTPTQESGYYNTNHLTSTELLKAQQDAKAQEDFILTLYQSGKPMSAWEVYSRCIKANRGMLIGSARRALTNLTYKRKALVKLGKEDMVKGPYGKPVFQWQIINQQNINQ